MPALHSNFDWPHAQKLLGLVLACLSISFKQFFPLPDESADLIFQASVFLNNQFSIDFAPKPVFLFQQGFCI